MGLLPTVMTISVLLRLALRAPIGPSHFATILDAALRGAASALAKAPSAATRKTALEKLRLALGSGNSSEVSAAIRRFLDSR